MDSTISSTTDQLQGQLANPSDILSLLLLIGGDVIQRAIAQLFGFYIKPFGTKIYLTPVAFSFGWVGYAFTSLTSVVGNKQLMPSAPESSSKVINCENGYARCNRSWLLERLLRDHEMNMEKHPGPEYEAIAASGRCMSLRIDIFNVEDPKKLTVDWVWYLGWLTITAQLAISLVPLVEWGNWGIFLVTASGTVAALITGSLRQWNAEKWAGRRLNKPGSRKKKKMAVLLTRGNGHKYVMMLRSSGMSWDLETMATATSDSNSETPWLLGALALIWACLLITVSGLKTRVWFLLGIGLLGMIQNILAGAVKRDFGTLDLKLTRQSFIIAPGFDWPQNLDDSNSDEDVADETERWRQPLAYDSVPGVRGAIREVEKMYPKSGFALMREFFPAMIKYEPGRYRTNSEKKFWKKASSHIKTM